LGYCTNPEIEERKNCHGLYTDEEGKSVDATWEIPFNNFDNVIWSMITFFELATLEGWPNTLLKIIDSQGEDLGPKIDNRPYAALLFIAFIFIQTFFVMNLFVSVIVDKFNEEIKRRQGSNTFTEEQKEWVKMQRIMLHVNLKIRPTIPTGSAIRKAVFKLVLSNYFEYFIVTTIAINTIFLCIDYHGSPVMLSKVI
jgi:Ion transport protein